MTTAMGKKIFLVIGIIILALFLIGPAATAGKKDKDDDKDKDSDKKAKSSKQLVITEVYVDFESSEIVISGRNFENGDAPIITLGDYLLSLLGNSDSQIVAGFPAVPDGDYLLTVSTGNKKKKYDSYALTIGAVGPQGPPGTFISLGDVTETSAAGGTGGSEFGPLDCPSDAIAVGFSGRSGDDIDRTWLRCKALGELGLFGPVLGPEVSGGAVGGYGGTDYGDTLMCPSGSALTGVRVRAGSTGVIDQMGSRCTGFGNGVVFNQDLVGSQESGWDITNLDCPAGSVVTGIRGRQGAVMDQIQLRCRSTQ